MGEVIAEDGGIDSAADGDVEGHGPNGGIAATFTKQAVKIVVAATLGGRRIIRSKDTHYEVRSNSFFGSKPSRRNIYEIHILR